MVLEVAIKEEKSFRSQNSPSISYGVGSLSITRLNKLYYIVSKWPFLKHYREIPISGALM